MGGLLIRGVPQYHSVTEHEDLWMKAVPRHIPSVPLRTLQYDQPMAASWKRSGTPPECFPSEESAIQTSKWWPQSQQTIFLCPISDLQSRSSAPSLQFYFRSSINSTGLRNSQNSAKQKSRKRKMAKQHTKESVRATTFLRKMVLFSWWMKLISKATSHGRQKNCILIIRAYAGFWAVNPLQRKEAKKGLNPELSQRMRF